MKTMCDPPEGWKYGFPKEIPQDVLNGTQYDFEQWITKNGYPKDKIKEYGDNFACSYWNTDEN